MTSSAIPPEPQAGGVNAPHPSDEDPSAFFGEDGEDGAQERSLMPDDADADESQNAAVEQQQEQPAAQQEQPAQQASAPLDLPKPAGEAQPGPGQQFDDGSGQKEVPPPASPAPAAAAPAASSPPAASPPAPAGGAAAGGEEKKQSSAPRGYIVLREVELTKEFLEHFLKEIEDGKDPRTAYFTLEGKVESRNPTPVLQAAFKKHHKRLGEPLRLAAIPLSAFRVRTLSLKPKVVDDNIEIE